MLFCAPLLAGGCASHAYAGVPFAPGASDPELQTLARRAQSGDKRAQLELGIRYEEGRGVRADRQRAERLYRLAATDSGGPIAIYSPPVGPHGEGEVVTVERGSLERGLPEAEARLARLRARDGQSGVGGASPADGPASANAHARALWGSVTGLLAGTNRDGGLGEALRGSVAARGAGAWRADHGTLTCPEGSSAAVFPLARAACETGRQRFQLSHFWDEAMAPGGATRLTPVRAGCLTARDALATLRGWQPHFYFARPPVAPSSSSPGAFTSNPTAEPKIVYVSGSGNLIYVDYYAPGSCLSNFFVIVPSA